MLPLITQNAEQIAAICRAHHVKRLAIFGSAVRDDFDPENSDIDLLYEFESSISSGNFRAYLALAEQFEALFGRNVDLISLEGVRNPFIRKRILEQQQELYAA